VPTLDEIAEPFQMVDRDMRIELLLEYADKLPELDEEYASLRDAGMNMVHECQSPVFMHVELNDGRVQVHTHVPREAPTARAFASILHEAFDGRRPEEVLDAPGDPLRLLGLSDLLGMQRTRGLAAIYKRARSQVKEKMDRASGDGASGAAPETPAEGDAA
jgi:cysteine desulfuration protein SufE